MASQFISPPNRLVSAGTRIPKEYSEIIDDIARTHLRSRSEIIRALIVARLSSLGHIPARAELKL